ncbi:thioesterase family protein [Microbacterium aoyamense]|uniref:Thioesterase family protein n=1 Tax=Microbacterium aoyamense TaxID=344166 RepID=A0ABN2PU26_9MICO
MQSGQIDENGHLNVIRYLDIQARATTVACGEYGLDLSYPAECGMGLFSVDHHARYLRELRLGDAYRVHVRLLGASVTGLHTMAYMVGIAGGEVVSTLESLLLNVDLETRRVTRLRSDRAERVAAGLRRDSALPWTSATCSSIRLRGRPLIDLPH